MKETLIELLSALCMHTSIDASNMIRMYHDVANVKMQKLRRSPYIEPVYAPRAFDLVFLSKTVGILVDDNVVFFMDEKEQLEFKLLSDADVKMFGRIRDKKDKDNLVLYHFKSFKRYKKVEHLISEVSAEEGIPEAILKSMLYVESRFDENAKSQTGVRGIAMITRETAQRFGINTSTSKGQILGMAKIWSDIMSKLDKEDYSLEERYRLAYFCYNRGMKYYFLARKKLANSGRKITYKNTMKELNRWSFCQEGIQYIQKIGEHAAMFA